MSFALLADGAGDHQKKQKASAELAFVLHKSLNYFLAGGAIASLVALATRNFTTVLALI